MYSLEETLLGILNKVLLEVSHLVSAPSFESVQSMPYVSCRPEGRRIEVFLPSQTKGTEDAMLISSVEKAAKGFPL